jgi:hypothetical protein
MSTQPLAISPSGMFFCPKKGKWLQGLAGAMLGAMIGYFGAHFGLGAATPIVNEALHRGEARTLLLPASR